jgi:UDP-N-acetyl-2-amino-2-deoxyglucuronate dehydrogenase
MESRVRFAIIGCGRVVGNHLDAIRRLPRATIAAVCDLDAARAKMYSDTFGVPWYTNYHEMLVAEQVDVVSIVTPSGMHPRHAVDVMEQHRKHVVIEKPMALRLADLDLLHDVAAKTGCRIFPVYQNRYNAAVDKVHAELQAQALGRLVVGTVRVRWCRPQRYYDQSVWRGTWALDGGCLTNQGIHYVDALLWLLGDVESVFAFKTTALARVEVEDTLVASLRFPNGALGQIEVTTAARPEDFEAEISVLGEKGTAVIGGLASNRLTVWTPDPGACPRYSEDIPNVYGFGHRPFYRDVVNDLLDGVPHPISLADGGRAVRLLNAIYRSTEDGAAVRLEAQPASSLLGRPEPELERLYVTPPADSARKVALQEERP